MAHVEYHGPWQTARLDLSRCRVDIESVERGDDLPEQGYAIAVAYSGATDEGHCARLIAAAPELLDGLESACDLLIGAAAWLEPAGQPMVAKGLREWVATRGQPTIRKATGL